MGRDGRERWRVSSLPKNAVGVEYTYDEIMAKGRKRKIAAAASKELYSAFGEKAIVQKKVNLDPDTREGRRNRKNMVDLMTPVWRAEAEDGRIAQSKVVRERLFDDAGRAVEVAAPLAESIAKKSGLRATRRLSFGPPAGGWPVFDKNGKVVG